MSQREIGPSVENPGNREAVVTASRKEQGELVDEVKRNLRVTKDVPGKPGEGVAVHTLDLPSGNLNTERFETEEDYKKYLEEQLSAEELSEYEQMNEEFEKVGEEVKESLERYLKADPYFAFQMQLFKEGRLPENQIPVVQGVLYSLTEGHPGAKAFGVKYESLTDKLMGVFQKAPPKLMAGLKDLFMEKDSGPKWLGSLFVALPIATIVGLETKGKTLRARLIDARYAKNTLIWITYLSRFLVTDFGGTTGGELIGKGFQGYGNFIKGSFKTGEEFFTARGLSNPANWKDKWQKITTGSTQKEENLQYIESNRYLAIRIKAYPGQIRAVIEKQLEGTSLTTEDIALAAKFRRQAVHTGIANMDKSLLDQDFFDPPRRITQADVLQAYASAAVKDLDRLLGDNPDYAAAKERQDNQALTPEEIADLKGLDPINWVKFVYSNAEQQAKQQEEIEKVFTEVLDDYKSEGETTGHHAFSPKGGSLSLDSDSFIDPPRKRTLLGFLMGGWLAATVLANTLAIGRNIIRKLYTGYVESQNKNKKEKETSAVDQQRRRETALKHLYPEKVEADKNGIYFEVKEFVKNPDKKDAVPKVDKVRYPSKETHKNGWAQNESDQVLNFLRQTPNIREKHLNAIIKVFVGWGLISKGSKEAERNAFNTLLNTGQTGNKDYTKEWGKSWEKPQSKSERMDILGQKFTFDYRKGPQGVIDELRNAFKNSPTNALATYFSVQTNKDNFTKNVLEKAQAWSLHPDVLEATYESTKSNIWNKGKSALYFAAGYTPVVPFIIHHNPTPGAGKARDAYNSVGYKSKPWFEVEKEAFLQEIIAPKEGEVSPDSKRITFRPNLTSAGKIEFIIPPSKVKSIKATGDAVIGFLKGEIKGGKFTLPTNLDDLYAILDNGNPKYKGQSFAKENFIRIIMGENV